MKQRPSYKGQWLDGFHSMTTYGGLAEEKENCSHSTRRHTKMSQFHKWINFIIHEIPDISSPSTIRLLAD